MGQNDHIGKSVLCALAAAGALSIMNMVSKILTETISPIEVTFWRNLVALAIMIPIIVAFGKTALMKTKRWKGQLFRAVIGTVGMVLAVWMFSLLSLADGVALSFTAPLFVILLSKPVLGERVGLFRTSAALIGFSGVLIIAQPWDSASLNILGLAIGMTFALLNAGVMLCLRWLSDTESSVTTVFYFLLFGLIGIAPFIPFNYTPIDGGDYWLVLTLGIVGIVSLMLKTESYRWGAASVVAPISYSLLLWALMFDWLIWNKTPSANVLIGASIIIASNAFILWREHKKQKHSVQTEFGSE
jgi:drug/metabolite transporter (DMT)-like permease